MDLALIIGLVAIGVFGYLGFRDGVVKRILEMVGVFAALLLTARLATDVSPWVMDKTGAAEGAALLMTWAGLFIIGLILSRILARVLSRVIRLTILSGLDKLGGALVGMAFGTLVVSVILVAASQVPGAEPIKESYDRTPVGRFIFYSAPNMYRYVRSLKGGQVESVWDRVLETGIEFKEAASDQLGGALEETADEIKEEIKNEVQEKIDDVTDK